MTHKSGRKVLAPAPIARSLDRLGARIEGLPGPLRATVGGALAVILMTLANGGVIALPIAAVYVLVARPHPFADFMFAGKIIGLVLLGGAASGFVYGTIGKRIGDAFRAGRYLSGIVVVVPYVLMLAMLDRLRHGEPLLSPLAGAERFTIGVMSAIFGPIVGGILWDLRHEAPQRHAAKDHESEGTSPSWFFYEPIAVDIALLISTVLLRDALPPALGPEPWLTVFTIGIIAWASLRLAPLAPDVPPLPYEAEGVAAVYTSLLRHPLGAMILGFIGAFIVTWAGLVFLMHESYPLIAWGGGIIVGAPLGATVWVDTFGDAARRARRAS